MEELSKNNRTNPEKILKVLREHNPDMEIGHAIKILAFLKRIAKIRVTEYLENHEFGGKQKS